MKNLLYICHNESIRGYADLKLQPDYSRYNDSTAPYRSETLMDVTLFKSIVAPPDFTW